MLVELFLRNMKDTLLYNYDYISTTESDVVVDDGSIEETIYILNENNEIPVSYIQINCDLEKYKKLPTAIWVPKPTKYKTFYTGITGFQFITFRRNILYDFLDRLKNNEIMSPIACGCSDFHGLSDINLGIYINNILGQKGGITNRKLDHIGWEKYMDVNGNLIESGDYCLEKKKHVYKTRSNELLNNIEQYEIKDITKLRCLFLTHFFPHNKAIWRMVTIHSFIEKYDTDILVSYKFHQFDEPTYEEMFEKFHLNKYDILIFDPKFNYLNKYNDIEFNGIIFNNWFNNSIYSFLFRLKKYRKELVNKDTWDQCSTLVSPQFYNFTFSIFISNYDIFNTNFNTRGFPRENQFIHLYPDRGYTPLPGHQDQFLNKEIIKSKWIVTQEFVYKQVEKYIGNNLFKVYGGPFFYKHETLVRKKVFNDNINICFTSLGDEKQKGAYEYIEIVKKIQDPQFKFFSVGNCPRHESITHYDKMSQEKLDRFYYDKIDIYINLSIGGDGFPLGVEAAKKGCILLTTDPYNSNIKNDFNIDNFFIIDRNNLDAIVKKILTLKPTIIRMDKSYYIQDKIYKLFNYKKQMTNGIFKIIDKYII